MATPEQHNKYLALTHIAFAVFTLFLMIAWTTFLYHYWGVEHMNDGQARFTIFGLLFVNGLNALYITPSIVAGWALLKRKKWSKNISLIAAVAAGMYIPLGPFVCGYSFWFFYSKQGQVLYS